MLGIRHFHGVAFDLYQGNITGFACDAFCAPLATKTPGGSFELDTKLINDAGPGVRKKLEQIDTATLDQGSIIVTAPGFLPVKKILFWLHEDRDFSSEKFMEKLCKAIADEQIEHLSFFLPSSPHFALKSSAILDKLEALIKRSPQMPLRRVSFLMENQKDYLSVQTVLFAKFPETS